MTTLSISAILGYAAYALTTYTPITNNVLLSEPRSATSGNPDTRIFVPGKITDTDINGSPPTQASPTPPISTSVIISESSALDGNNQVSYILLPGKISDSDIDGAEPTHVAP